MAFYIYLLIGFISGIIGGMGMGGGTLLIPMLTIFCGVEQKIAQSVNLFVFLPTAIFALIIHSKNNLIQTHNLFWIIIPAIIFSILGSLCAVYTPQVWLKRGFGIFLILLALYQTFEILKTIIKKRSKND